MEKRHYTKLRGAKMTYCKQCSFPIKFEECGHQMCVHAYARGFCSQTCSNFYDQEKQFTLNKMEKFA